MFSWKVLRWMRNIGLAVYFCGWVTDFTAGKVFGIILMLVAYQALLLKAEQVLSVAFPDKTSQDSK